MEGAAEEEEEGEEGNEERAGQSAPPSLDCSYIQQSDIQFLVSGFRGLCPPSFAEFMMVSVGLHLGISHEDTNIHTHTHTHTHVHNFSSTQTPNTHRHTHHSDTLTPHSLTHKRTDINTHAHTHTNQSDSGDEQTRTQGCDYCQKGQLVPAGRQ